MRTRVKICCIASIDEATLAISAGADALGLVAEMPSGPGPIDDVSIAKIAQFAPPPLATFLLTCRVKASEIINHHHRTRANTLQLVDHVPVADLVEIRRALPGTKMVQVIHVEDESSIADALSVAAYVDALLLDSGRPKLAVKELGGTGRVHNWKISREIVEQSPVPVFLAGGLNPANVAEAINSVLPFGLDLCSGVRTDGKLDPYKLEAFMKVVAGV